MINLLIVTALTEEAQVVAAVLGAVATRARREHIGDVSVSLYDFPVGNGNTGGTSRIGAVSAHQIGAVGMGVFTAPLLKELQPRCAALIGIAAAINASQVSLGDVPFADQVVSYDDIAVQHGVLTFRSQGFQVDPAMRAAVGELRTSVETYRPWQEACETTIAAVVENLNRLRRRQIKPAKVGSPHLVVDAVAGGPFLLRDSDFRDSLRKTASKLPAHNSILVSSPLHPKLVSAEMEAHGFMRAAHQYGVPAVVLKGISDDGDKDKAELEEKTGGFYRAYACSNAALAALHLLRVRPMPRIGDKERATHRPADAPKGIRAHGVEAGGSVKARTEGGQPIDAQNGKAGENVDLTMELSALVVEWGDQGYSGSQALVSSTFSRWRPKFVVRSRGESKILRTIVMRYYSGDELYYESPLRQYNILINKNGWSPSYHPPVQSSLALTRPDMTREEIAGLIVEFDFHICNNDGANNVVVECHRVVVATGKATLVFDGRGPQQTRNARPDEVADRLIETDKPSVILREMFADRTADVQRFLCENDEYEVFDSALAEALETYPSWSRVHRAKQSRIVQGIAAFFDDGKIGFTKPLPWVSASRLARLSMKLIDQDLRASVGENNISFLASLVLEGDGGNVLDRFSELVNRRRDDPHSDWGILWHNQLHIILSAWERFDHGRATSWVARVVREQKKAVRLLGHFLLPSHTSDWAKRFDFGLAERLMSDTVLRATIDGIDMNKLGDEFVDYREIGREVQDRYYEDLPKN